jgi:hypothetical protein
MGISGTPSWACWLHALVNLTTGFPRCCTISMNESRHIAGLTSSIRLPSNHTQFELCPSANGRHRVIRVMVTVRPLRGIVILLQVLTLTSRWDQNIIHHTICCSHVGSFSLVLFVLTFHCSVPLTISSIVICHSWFVVLTILMPINFRPFMSLTMYGHGAFGSGPPLHHLFSL